MLNKGEVAYAASLFICNIVYVLPILLVAISKIGGGVRGVEKPPIFPTTSISVSMSVRLDYTSDILKFRYLTDISKIDYLTDRLSEWLKPFVPILLQSY